MNHKQLAALFKPRTVAVVGASQRQGPGLQVIENLRAVGFGGSVIPINPKYASVAGFPCYPSLTEAAAQGHEIDLVAVLLGKEMVLPVMEEAASVGVKAGWAFAAGFGETDSEGRALEARLRDLCEQNGMLFLGPNCVGFLNINDRTCAYSAPAPKHMIQGNIGMVAQSGYLSLAIANNSRGLGFGLICSTGNEVVVEAADCIDYMLEDDGIDVVLAFIEQFRNPHKLVEAALKAREKRKPIVLIKVGKSKLAQRATVAHTGALAGSDDVQQALFDKLGIIRVSDLDEMFETAELLSKVKDRMPRGNSIVAVTLSGGVISLMGDLSESLDISFPPWSESAKSSLAGILPHYSSIHNPLDAWGSGRIEDTYLQCVQAGASQEHIDMVLVVQDVPANMSQRQVEQYSVVAHAAVTVAGETDKPVVMLNNQSSGVDPVISEIVSSAGNVALLQGTREGLLALHHLSRYAKFLQQPVEIAVQAKASSARRYDNLPEGKTVLNEHESKKLVSAYGVPVTRERLCGTKKEALEAAVELGFPLVMKLISRDIQHKTEAKVVKLHIKDEEEAAQAYDQVVMNALAYNPDARIDGVLCYQMVEEPVAEAIVGIITDPYFGPAVVFGLGGIMVEVFKDRSLMIPPITREEALKAVQSIKGYTLLDGFRGKKPGDLDALVEVIIRMGELALDLADRIDAVDVNPLLILPKGHGVVAVDALVSLI